MNPGGDAAEQVVRLSLEGVEVAARITGNGAKNIAILLHAVLKEEQKTKGKTRLTNMLRTGKELKVYTVQQKDLKKFTQEAKRYGVLYCVLRDKNNKDENAVVDVIARAEDASKIQRITERFRLGTVPTASVTGSVKEQEKYFPEKDAREKKEPEARSERTMGAGPGKQKQKANPDLAKTANDPPSEPSLRQTSRSNGSIGMNRPSVREKLNYYRKRQSREQKLSREKEKMPSSKETAVKVPLPKRPGKER